MLLHKKEIFNDVDSLFYVFTNISDLVFIMNVDEEGQFRYIFVNEPAMKMSGMTEDAIGKTIQEVMPKESSEALLKHYKNAVQQKACITFEDTVTPDEHYYESKITPFFDDYGNCTHIIAIVRDVSDRKRKEIELNALKERYQSLFKYNSNGIYSVDLQGLITSVNPSIVNITGYTENELLGNNITSFIVPDCIEHTVQSFLKASKGESQKFESALYHKDGHKVYLTIINVPIWINEQITGVFGIVSDLTERKLLEEKLSYLAYHDTLTGLPNRRLFKEKLEQSILEADRYGRKIAVMFLDLDQFKRINDTLGHDAGDELLTHFSQRVKGCLRKSDTLARLGGDEFCALLEISKEQDAIIIAEKIINCLQDKWRISTAEFTATSSIGIAIYKEGFTSDTLIKAADIALYHAKEKGRNNYQLYPSEQ